MVYNTKRSTDSAVEATEELLEHLELASEEKENMPRPGVCAGERPGPGAGGEPNCDIACEPASTAQCTKMTETEVADRRNLTEIKI